jgi:hypothetical protein
MRKAHSPASLTAEEVAAIEARLNTDQDALVSSILASDQVEGFSFHLQCFIERRKSDISVMCGEHSLTFAQSIEGAQTLGGSAVQLRDRVRSVESQVRETVHGYEAHLVDAVTLSRSIDEVDRDLEAVSEALVVIQRLKNINEQTIQKNSSVALVRCIEFQEYDSTIASATIINGFQRDAEDVIKHIVKQAECDMKMWLADFRRFSNEFGSACLMECQSRIRVSHLCMRIIWLRSGLGSWRRSGHITKKLANRNGGCSFKIVRHEFHGRQYGGLAWFGFCRHQRMRIWKV